MKKFDIFPTNSEIIKSINLDNTGRNGDIVGFLRMLINIEDLTSIAINAEWGSGKTFFIKQCLYIIDSINNEVNEINGINISEIEDKLSNTRAVYFDAWKSDNDSEPLISIIKSVSTSSWFEKFYKQHENTLHKIVNSLNALVNILSKSNVLPSNINDISDFFSNGSNDVEKSFKDELSRLIPKEGKLIVFIDELDRCNPSYAVKLLERIKHYLNIDGIIFVFSTDILQLQHTVTHYYGDKFDGLHYLDRFFDLVIPLPRANIDKYIKSSQMIDAINNLYDGNSSNWYSEFCKELIEYFNFSLREINHFIFRTNYSMYEYISLNKHKFYNSHGIEKSMHGMYMFIIPALIASDIDDHELYQHIIGGVDTTFIVDFLKKSKECNDYLTNRHLNSSDSEDIDFFELASGLFDPSVEGYYDALSENRKDIIRITSLLSEKIKIN